MSNQGFKVQLKSLLEVISTLRHDFLNHLQVISGLLQLNKTERAREYMRSISAEIERMSKIMHLGVPEATAEFLIAHYRAINHQVEMVYNIETNLAECSVTGEIVGRVLEQCLNYALLFLSPLEVERRRLEVNLTGTVKGYVCRLQFSVPPEQTATEVQRRILDLGEELKPFGVQVRMLITRENSEIYIFLPRTSVKT